MEIKNHFLSAKGCSKAAEIAKGLEAMDSLYSCENFSPQRYIADDRTAALSESLGHVDGKEFCLLRRSHIRRSCGDCRQSHSAAGEAKD